MPRLFHFDQVVAGAPFLARADHGSRAGAQFAAVHVDGVGGAGVDQMERIAFPDDLRLDARDAAQRVDQHHVATRVAAQGAALGVERGVYRRWSLVCVGRLGCQTQVHFKSFRGGPDSALPRIARGPIRPDHGSRIGRGFHAGDERCLVQALRRHLFEDVHEVHLHELHGAADQERCGVGRLVDFQIAADQLQLSHSVLARVDAANALGPVRHAVAAER
ncbi:hypothetical protein SDC9_169407 [bioreactor metagenome]|uniref:Uncharacterized protein n=1 Tax=bioreactor metagenome TaxID=1076179 RepID=A0A645GDD3_9ZZZZ